ncbi:hypothetical protein Pint_28028 [Pistacia integerrima]|uniref:Uncharacterized protein n=1 Tax=Pistacia integerrima TaxID=434235 RepID=A0ACC0YV24_9ROSI|nr:hypothetical protein Pint_28028 [Pistacia integerrima]
MTNSTTSFFINCNNAGAEFVRAVVDGVPVAEVSEPVYVPDQIVYSFFPLNGVSKYEGISKPLLAVQITELVDGIFIGCTINYCVADGTSFWHFFNSWSKMSRGFDCVSKPPVLQRWFLRDTDCPIHMPLSISEQLSNTFKPPPLQQREVFSKLKTKVNAELGYVAWQINNIVAM